MKETYTNAPQQTEPENKETKAPNPPEPEIYHMCPIGYRPKKQNKKNLCEISKDGEPCPDGEDCCEKESAVTFRWLGIFFAIIFFIVYVVVHVNANKNLGDEKGNGEYKFFNFIVPIFNLKMGENQNPGALSYTIGSLILIAIIVIFCVYTERAFSNSYDFSDTQKCPVEIPHTFPHLHVHDEDEEHPNSHSHNHAWLEKSHDHDHGHLPPNTVFSLI